jgi:GT2 family glycosyltransferase
MSLPFISIVIPTRDRPEDLANCLLALSRQSVGVDNFEVIVVNDHSNANTLSQYYQIVSTHADMRIQLMNLPNHQRGSVHARNLGVQHTSGEVIGFLDDDSIPEADWVFVAATYFTQYPNVTAITGVINAVDNEHPVSAFRQNFYNIRYRKLLHPESTLTIQKRFHLTRPENVYLADFLAGGNSAIRSTVFEKYGMFDTSFVMMHDKELALRLIKHGRICAFLPNLVIRHNHTKSITDAMSKSFRSGMSHYHLQAKYSDVLTDEVFDPAKPFKTIKMSTSFLSMLGVRSTLLIPFIIILEYLHQAGYIFELCKTRFQIY